MDLISLYYYFFLTSGPLFLLLPQINYTDLIIPKATVISLTMEVTESADEYSIPY